MITQFGQLAWRLLASLFMLAGIAAMSLGSSEPSLNEEALKNMEVHSIWAGQEPVPLTAGAYRDVSGPADAVETVVRLTEQITFGELSGRPAAGAVLVADPGPSGILYYFLAVVVEQEGELVNVASSLLGPWVQVDSIAIEDEEIILDMVSHGPDDPLCCPTREVRLTYVLQEDTLALGSYPGRTSLSARE